MAIVISDERIIKRLNQLADQLNQTPEQVIADAIDQFEPASQGNDQKFWEAIRGIGSSGDPDLASRVKDILREEVDPIEGWSRRRDAKDTD
jgi:hypothetical protein